MISLLALLLQAAVAALPVGVEVDCSTWPAAVATELKVTVVASDGSKNVTGKIEIARTADAGVVQVTLVVALEEPGWTVKASPGHTVVVFAPKGKSVNSIRFDSDGWVPVYRFIPGPAASATPGVKKPEK